MHAWL
jgi:hypothetical protein